MYAAAVAAIATGECTVAEVECRAVSHSDDLPIAGLRRKPAVECVAAEIEGDGLVASDFKHTGDWDVLREQDVGAVGDGVAQFGLIANGDVGLRPNALREGKKNKKKD